jgi:predicted 2-oxoglutarate/Fe(II)-dependent dioxygenase YbiX/peroxiredoxin
MTATAQISSPQPASYINLAPGDPAPWFHQKSSSNPDYAFHTTAGRYIVLCFYGTAGDALGRDAIEGVLAQRGIFDDQNFSFFGVSLDPKDEAEKRVQESMPGIRYFWDFDGAISRLYGAVPKGSTPGAVQARRFWVVMDPTLRVLQIIPFTSDHSNATAVISYLQQLPPPARFAGIELQAPILFLPNVFEPDFCNHLTGLYEKNGGQESGFVREVGGKTMILNDHAQKRRKDYMITDSQLMQQIQMRIVRRIAPEILKVYSFKATRMERYIVACYAAEDRGHFQPHRDNTTKGTAHRRFAVSINLNDAFEGGEVSFPEYGPRSFKPPPGGAVIFPCALLHAVSPVTSGRRYAFLPFLYDDEAAKIREANNQFLDKSIAAYKAN